jgi:hypothetical protein
VLKGVDGTDAATHFNRRTHDQETVLGDGRCGCGSRIASGLWEQQQFLVQLGRTGGGAGSHDERPGSFE